jgi:hypothetical protein
MEEALRLVETGTESCVVVREDKIIYAASGRGVSPLLALYTHEPEKLRDAFVLDAIIGKAAAVILILGGARRAYGKIMSVAARDYLAAHGIIAEYGSLVENITNRSGDGLCPMERAVLGITDPAECLERIQGALSGIMAKSQSR